MLNIVCCNHHIAGSGDPAVLIVALQTPPFLMERNFTDDGTLAKGNDRYYGYCADLMVELAQNCSALSSYQLIPVHDNQYGRRQVDGTWTGMIGELIEGVREQ